LTEDVIVSRRDGLMRITMNRPQRKNALTAAMYDKMTGALEEAEGDDAIRAILL